MDRPTSSNHSIRTGRPVKPKKSDSGSSGEWLSARVRRPVVEIVSNGSRKQQGGSSEKEQAISGGRGRGVSNEDEELSYAIEECDSDLGSNLPDMVDQDEPLSDLFGSPGVHQEAALPNLENNSPLSEPLEAIYTFPESFLPNVQPSQALSDSLEEFVTIPDSQYYREGDQEPLSDPVETEHTVSASYVEGQEPLSDPLEELFNNRAELSMSAGDENSREPVSDIFLELFQQQEDERASNSIVVDSDEDEKEEFVIDSSSDDGGSQQRVGCLTQCTSSSRVAKHISPVKRPKRKHSDSSRRNGFSKVSRFSKPAVVSLISSQNPRPFPNRESFNFNRTLSASSKHSSVSVVASSVVDSQNNVHLIDEEDDNQEGNSGDEFVIEDAEGHPGDEYNYVRVQPVRPLSPPREQLRNWRNGGCSGRFSKRFSEKRINRMMDRHDPNTRTVEVKTAQSIRAWGLTLSTLQNGQTLMQNDYRSRRPSICPAPNTTLKLAVPLLTLPLKSSRLPLILDPLIIK